MGKQPRKGQQGDPSLLPIIEQGYKLWEVVNAAKFGGQLPAPVLLIASNSRLKDANRLGWCTTNRVWTQAKTQEELATAPGAFEIGLAAEYLHRPPDQICQTWIHEFAHYWNWFRKIADCNGRTQYHNQKFKAAAEELGLEVKHDKTRGWAWTSLGPEARKLIEQANIDQSAFAWCRINTLNGGGRQKQPTKMKKWICECQPKPVIIRAAVELDVVCQICEAPFTKAPGQEDPDES